MTVASQNFQMRQFHWDVVIYSLTKVTQAGNPKNPNQDLACGNSQWDLPWHKHRWGRTHREIPSTVCGFMCHYRQLTPQWLMMPITHCHPNAMWEEKKAPSELKWHSLLSQSLALFLFLPLRGWNSVKHALVLTWDGYGNMFSYPRLLFSAKSFTGGLIQTGRKEEMLKLVKS